MKSMIDLFKDSVVDINRWRNVKDESIRNVVENPFDSYDMGDRFYLEIEPDRYVRIYEGDYVVSFGDGSQMVYPSRAMQNLMINEENKIDRLLTNKKSDAEVELSQQQRGRDDLHSEEKFACESGNLGRS